MTETADITENTDATEIKDAITLYCTCGCSEGFRFQYAFNQIYVSAIWSVHSSLYSPILGSLLQMGRNAFLKNRYVIAPLATREDLRKLYGWLEKHHCSDGKTSNSSQLDISALDDDGLCEVVLVPTQSRFDSLRGKLYRTGEIVLNEKDRRRLLGQIAKALKNIPEKQKEPEGGKNGY